MFPSISFVIPVLNGDNTIYRCIHSIKSLSYPSELIEIIVINNGSKDKTQSILDRIDGITVYQLDEKSRSKARNLGWKKSKFELVAFVDSDVYLDKLWARFLTRLINENPMMGCAQGVIRPIGNGDFLDSYRKWRKFHQTNEFGVETTINNICYPIVNTASCIYRREVLEKLEGFDETLIRFEDIDLSYRTSCLSYFVGFSTDANSFVSWSEEKILPYIKREWENGKWSLELTLKYFSKPNLLISFIALVKSALQSLLIPSLEFKLNLFEFVLKTVFGVSYFKQALFSKRALVASTKESIFSYNFTNSEKDKVLQKAIGQILRINDERIIKKIYSKSAVRIVYSDQSVHFHQGFSLIFRDEEAHFLKSLFLNDNKYFQEVPIERISHVASNVFKKLVDNKYLNVHIQLDEFCFNPFNTYRKMVNQDDELEYFILNKNIQFQHEILENLHFNKSDDFNVAAYLNSLLESENWTEFNREIPSELFLELNRNQIIIEKSKLKTLIEKPFSLRDFLNQLDIDQDKLDRIDSTQFKVHRDLLNQFSGQYDFKSKIYQMNNFMSLSENLFWTCPYLYNYAFPIYLENNEIEKLKNFNINDWSKKELYGLWKAGILEDEAFLEIDTSKLKKDFNENQFFSFTMKESDYLIWALDNFLYLYFNSGAFKVGDSQCADRKAVYDNFLCLHLQKGFENVLNRIMPFELKASFNYSVCYHPYADLYPHKDRDEAPYSMSLNLGTYLNSEKKIESTNILGVENDNGKKDEIPLTFGDAALFNGYELTHYREQIPKDHYLNVIVMHFVRADYQGDIG